MLDELISYIAGFPDVWFATHLEVAEEWRAVQEHEGTIACDSIPGKGTRFTLSLPLASAQRATRRR